MGPTKLERLAPILIALGGLILLVGSGLHLAGGYPLVLAALAKSNLDIGTQNALRSVFLLIAITWMTVALAALLATFVRTRTSKWMILLCGAGLLLQIPIWVTLMGWFIGNEMFFLGAALVVIGGILFPKPVSGKKLSP